MTSIRQLSKQPINRIPEDLGRNGAKEGRLIRQIMSAFESGILYTTDVVNNAVIGVIDHGALLGLVDDDHIQYLLLAGRGGSQTVNGPMFFNKLVTVQPDSATNALNLKAFNTTTRWLDFLNSSGVSVGGLRMGTSPAMVRLLINTTSQAGIINIVPVAAMATTVSLFRAVWTDTANLTSGTNGYFLIQPTLSDPVNGVGYTFGFRYDAKITNSTNDHNGLEVNVWADEEDALTGGATTTVRAIHFEARSTGAGTLAALRGFQGGSRHTATGTLADLVGGSYYLITDAGAGLVTDAAVMVSLDSLGIRSAVTNLYGLRILNQTISGAGSVVNNYGIKIEARSGGTNVRSLQVDGSAVSIHAPNCSIGQTAAPTAKLHLGAGTTAASTAPLKLTSGTSMTSAEAGAVEYTTDDLFFTISTGTARKRLAMADAAAGLTSGFVPRATTNGRLADAAQKGIAAIVGDGADPPAAGEIGKVNRTAQTADIASTNLTNGTAAGFYVIDAVLEDTTSDVTAGVVTVTFGWTDDAGATTDATLTQVLTAVGRSRITVPLYLASGNVTYSTAHTGIFGSAAYALRIRCRFMG